MTQRGDLRIGAVIAAGAGLVGVPAHFRAGRELCFVERCVMTQRGIFLVAFGVGAALPIAGAVGVPADFGTGGSLGLDRHHVMPQRRDRLIGFCIVAAPVLAVISALQTRLGAGGLLNSPYVPGSGHVVANRTAPLAAAHRAAQLAAVLRSVTRGFAGFVNGLSDEFLVIRMAGLGDLLPLHDLSAVFAGAAQHLLARLLAGRFPDDLPLRAFGAVAERIDGFAADGAAPLQRAHRAFVSRGGAGFGAGGGRFRPKRLRVIMIDFGKL